LLASLLLMPINAARAASHGPIEASTSPTTAAASAAQLVGQKLMVAMQGTTPSADLLGRVRRGEIGGVILYGSNIRSATQLAALTAALRQAAVQGGQPPLLISTDQEGGSVKRVAWAPPTLSPPQMGALGSASTATSQGKATGIVLACAGINNDLAPVADVPSSTASFMYQEGRTWSFDATLTATLSEAFASGLGAGHGVPTMKHFPGIGLAVANTDSSVITIKASASALAPGLRPYKRAIGHGIPMIMLSNATYTAYDDRNAAGWSRAISDGLLRQVLGFTGVSITDSLNGTAHARGLSPTSLAIRAARAGTDMILLTGPELKSKQAYASLVLAVQDGTIPLPRLQASYQRILALKARLAPPTADTTAPAVTAPVSHLPALTTLGSTTARMRTAWSATDPCRISRFTVQRQENGGAWELQALPSGTSRSMEQSLAFGSSYRYRLKSTDGAGNTSPWIAGSSFTVRRTQQSAHSVSYQGAWSTIAHAGASGGTLAYSTAADASATFAFTGRGVGWVTSRGPGYGSAAIYVDGAYVKTVSLYAAAYQARQVMFTRNWGANAARTLTIVNLGTAGHSRVDVDAFAWLSAP
jgi:beta-N-acetylhexosaminidase